MDCLTKPQRRASALCRAITLLLPRRDLPILARLF